jgi:uncharacterized GH25 family protein
MKMSVSAREALLGATMVALVAGALHGHDFWLIPDAFQTAPGELVQVRGQTSSAFPSSESAVAVDRIAEAVVVDAVGRETITDVTHAGTSLVLRHRPRRTGQYVVTTVIHPRTVRESAEGFRRYLVLEGAPEILERLEREGGLPTDSISRRYAKYAKTLLQVGEAGPRAFAHVIGHPLEFLPLSDPAAARSADTLRVQLLLHGRPLAGAKVHAGSVVRAAGTPLDELAGTERHAELQTDVNGVVRVAIDRAGIWNIRALYLEPALPAAGVDWETHWATLVFEVVTGVAPLPGGQVEP